MDVASPIDSIRWDYRDGKCYANCRLAACIKMVGLVSYHGDYLMPGHTEQTGRRTIQKIDPKITTIIYHDGS